MQKPNSAAIRDLDEPVLPAPDGAATHFGGNVSSEAGDLDERVLPAPDGAATHFGGN